MSITWEVIDPGFGATYRERVRQEVIIVDVNTIIDAPWRAYPAVALAAAGLVLLSKGLWFGFRGSDGLFHEREALGWMRGFRLAVVGLCIVCIAVAWVWHVLWLFAVALGILGEELLETSVIIEVLKRNPPPSRSNHRMPSIGSEVARTG